MPLVALKPIIDATKKYGFGQAAFNVNSVDQAIAAIKIHESLRAPLLLQAAELALGFMSGKSNFAESTLEDKRDGAKILGDVVRAYAEKASIPVALHLDHGQNLDVVKAAIDGGFTSVMYDGSALPYEENLLNTREVVEYAHARGVTVEAELGILAGVEDQVFSENSTYTNPLQALDFVNRTGVDLLAISYGTMHGPNKGKNIKLRKEIVVTITELFLNEKIDCGLVSHGSSTIPKYIVDDLSELGYEVSAAGGVSISELQKVIKCGINKINIDTDIRMATTRNLTELFDQSNELIELDLIKSLSEKYNGKNIDPRLMLSPFMGQVRTGFNSDNPEEKLIKEAIDKAINEVCSQIITNFGMLGKAKLVENISLEVMKKVYAGE